MAFATIEGTVDYAKRGGKGFTVVESWEVRGETFKRRWNVWFKEETTLEIGSSVKLTGNLGGKVGEPWQDREGQTRPGGVEWSLNNATHVGGGQQGQGGAQSSNTRADDGWATSTPQVGAQAVSGYGSETPF